MISTVPMLIGGLHQPQPGFVDERRRLQGVPGCFVRHSRGGQPAQLFVHERKQIIGGLRISSSRRVEELSDL
jgi:hypothetical protein